MYGDSGWRGRGRGGGRGYDSGRGFGRGGLGRGSGRGRGLPQAPGATGATDTYTRTYVAKWTALVELELAAERAAFEERINNTPDDKLQAQGLVLLGVKAQETFADPTGSGQTLARLNLPASAQSRRHNFTPGDFVLIRSKDLYRAQGGRWEGIIMDISSGSMRLQLYEQATDAVSEPDQEKSLNNWPADELARGLHVRVDKGFNRVSYDRQLYALQMMMACQDTLAPGPPAAFRLDELEQYNLTATWVRDVLVAPARPPPAMPAARQTHHCQPADTPGDILWIIGSTLFSWAFPQTAAALFRSRREADVCPQVASVHCSTKSLASQPSFLRSPFNNGLWDLQEKVCSRLPRSNPTQQAAVATALFHRLALIQGPPGTGKTKTTAELVCFAKECMKGSLSAPVLVCAQSNTAVDKLVEELLAKELNVVRLGNPTKIQPDLLKTTLDYRMKNHPTFPELQQLVDQIVRLSRQLSELRGSIWSAVQGEEFVKELRAEKRALQIDINDLRHTMKKDIVMGAQVVCSTCIGAGSPDLKGFSFPLLVLDEGSQASEPEALVPIMKGTHQVIIVGDHKQLPPTVMSEKALVKGLGVSLFERLTEAGVPSTLLGVQYRAHPLLFEFPSARFYFGAVQSGVSPEQRPQLTPPFPPLKPNVPRAMTKNGDASPVVFINLPDGQEAIGSSGKSKVNEAEAQLVQQVVLWLQRAAGLANEHIGVVSPYAAQVELLKQKFLDASSSSAASAARASKQAAEGTAQSQGQGPGCGTWAQGSIVVTAPATGHVQVASVDGFQGREKEVIVFSTVRSNAGGKIGFLRDPRRLNVAITRAKRLLVVVGNKATLAAGGCPHWTAWMEYLVDKGWVLPAASLALS